MAALRFESEIVLLLYLRCFVVECYVNTDKFVGKAYFLKNLGLHNVFFKLLRRFYSRDGAEGLRFKYLLQKNIILEKYLFNIKIYIYFSNSE